MICAGGDTEGWEKDHVAWRVKEFIYGRPYGSQLASAHALSITSIAAAAATSDACDVIQWNFNNEVQSYLMYGTS